MQYQLTDWLPTTKKEMELRGWGSVDIILFSADAYVDHPSFGCAVIGRLLEAEGYRVAIVPQPDWHGDYRDFKDGDNQSALEDSTVVEQIYKDMTPIEKANAISNTARVYKGGGWNDRAIWLNPAQRRWLDERACRNDIGFRCVMSTVGGRDHEREQERDN